MSELLNKLSSYNVFNYLLPGIVFAILAEGIIGYPIVQRDIVTGVFLYYFVGLVVSRLGSLVVEPVLKRLSFIQYAQYNDFVDASKNDEKIGVLLEASNTYRTFSALFCLLLLLKLHMKIETKFPIVRAWDATIVAVLLLVVFLLSFRKQTTYITERVKANLTLRSRQ